MIKKLFLINQNQNDSSNSFFHTYDTLLYKVLPNSTDNSVKISNIYAVKQFLLNNLCELFLTLLTLHLSCLCISQIKTCIRSKKEREKMIYCSYKKILLICIGAIRNGVLVLRGGYPDNIQPKL